MSVNNNSDDNPIVVLGATGRVGSVVAHQLLAGGHRVIAIARHADKLQDLANKGAEVRAGAIENQMFLNYAFANARAAFILTPGDTNSKDLHEDQRLYNEHIVAALKQSNISHVVFLSSWGAELPEKSGTIYGCYLMEQLLNKIEDLNCVHLRAVWFMDNFIYNIGLIKMASINGLAIDGDFAFPCIDSRDIGRVAADYLSTLNFQGKSIRYLQGPRDYTMNQVTAVIGGVIGKPSLKYVKLPATVMLKGLTSNGISANVAELLIETNRKINTSIVHGQPRTPNNTTTTALEEFVRTKFLPSYEREPEPSFVVTLQGTLLRIFLRLT